MNQGAIGKKKKKKNLRMKKQNLKKKKKKKKKKKTKKNPMMKKKNPMMKTKKKTKEELISHLWELAEMAAGPPPASFLACVLISQRSLRAKKLWRS
jgi:hypothetical protein